MKLTNQNQNAFERHLIDCSANQALDVTYFDFGVPGTNNRCTLGLGMDGTCFVPAVMHPQGADGAFVKAGLDKIMVTQHGGHLYVPSRWLIDELRGDRFEHQKQVVIERMEHALRSMPLARAH